MFLHKQATMSKVDRDTGRTLKIIISLNRRKQVTSNNGVKTRMRDMEHKIVKQHSRQKVIIESDSTYLSTQKMRENESNNKISGKGLAVVELHSKYSNLSWNCVQTLILL